MAFADFPTLPEKFSEVNGVFFQENTEGIPVASLMPVASKSFTDVFRTGTAAMEDVAGVAR